MELQFQVAGTPHLKPLLDDPALHSGGLGIPPSKVTSKRSCGRPCRRIFLDPKTGGKQPGMHMRVRVHRLHGEDVRLGTPEFGKCPLPVIVINPGAPSYLKVFDGDEEEGQATCPRLRRVFPRAQVLGT